MYMQVPELPPRYEIIFDDKFDADEADWIGWYMFHDGENIFDYDDEDPFAKPCNDREDAVAACWRHWEEFSLDSQWREYIEYMRRADLEAARMRDYVNSRVEQVKK